MKRFVFPPAELALTATEASSCATAAAAAFENCNDPPPPPLFPAQTGAQAAAADRCERLEFWLPRSLAGIARAAGNCDARRQGEVLNGAVRCSWRKLFTDEVVLRCSKRRR
jgi:hypothetical protein